MAYLNRLILCLLFLVPTVYSGTASAFVQDAVNSYATTAFSTPTSTTRPPACSNLVGKWINSFGTVTTSTLTDNATSWGVCTVMNSSNQTTTVAITNTYTCPAGFTKTGSNYSATCTQADVTCTAPKVRDPSTNTCRDPCTDGTTVSTGPYKSNNNPTVACMNGCEVLKVSDGAPYVDCTALGGGASLGSCYYVYPAHYVQDGVSCTVPTNPPPTPATLSPPSCDACNCLEKGQSFGTANGVTVCVPRGSAGSAPVSTSTPGKTVSNTPAPTAQNPNPAPVVTQQPDVIVTITPAPAGSPSNAPPVISETTTNADGSTTTTSQGKDGYCKDNATSKECKGQDSAFSYSCTAGAAAIKCEGDAITCAIAARQHTDNCDAQKAAAALALKPAYTTGEKLLNGEYDTDVQNFMNHTGNSSRNVTLPSSLSETGDANFGSVGFSDVSVSAMGQSMSLPFSKANQSFEYFGYILLALAYLGAYKIVSGAF